MKLVKQSFEIIPQEEGINSIYKQIELAGRVCYKSENKITEDSAKSFVDMLINNKHCAMLEHGTVYLLIPSSADSDTILSYTYNPYSKVHIDNYGNFCVTSNYRVLIENNWLGDLKYLCEPTKYHSKRITVKFITDQGILREFTRHRRFSFAVESTRYCNYSKNRFNNEVTFIQPNWIKDEDITNDEGDYGYFVDSDNDYITSVNRFISSLKNAEYFYLELLKLGWKPQQARNVLPLATKCEMIMTGFVSDWVEFFKLRASEAGAKGMHPQADELASALYKEFINKKYIVLE